MLFTGNENTLLPDYDPPHTFRGPPPPPLDVSTSLLSMFDHFSIQ